MTKTTETETRNTRDKTTCECSRPLPMHLVEIVTSHNCACGRRYTTKDGAFLYVDTNKVVARMEEAWRHRDFVVFEEKHGDRYFSLGSGLGVERHAAWLRICLYLFQKRDENGMYAQKAPGELMEPPPVDPTAPLAKQRAMLHALETHARRQAEHAYATREWALLCVARDAAHPDREKAARELIESAQESEYQSYRFETFSRIEEST